MTGVQTCALPICFPVTILEAIGVKDYRAGMWLVPAYIERRIKEFEASGVEVVIL